MNPLQLRELNRAQPFEPYRIFLSDGTHHDVVHPEFIWVGARACHLGIPDADEVGLLSRVIRISTIHITSVKALSHINA
jgi:hypothetical protein